LGFTVEPVGWVNTERRDPEDTDHWGQVVSTIAIDDRFGDDCLVGLDGFSHVEVLFVFHLANDRADYTGTRRPRGSTDLPAVGVFSDRGPRRPNRLGATICEVIDCAAGVLRVRGLDAVEGTPVLDIKPVMAEFLPAQVDQPEWSRRLMEHYFRA
jgi:tRNA-Thr(GGU) m(6)t(6)A37 methyltransferase TsaA